MRLLVLGAGVSGRAVSRLARERGHSVTVYDEQDPDAALALDLGVGAVAGAWDSGLLGGVDLVVASPGFSERSLPVVETLEAGLPVWSEIEFAWRCLDEGVPVIAITGTNGKTTVTSLTARMLAASGLRTAASGNIGTALSEVVGMDLDVVVVEVSSFQLRFVERFHPRAAAVLNVAVDHLDWHGSAEAYAAAKARIFEHQGPDDLLVYDADDAGAAALVRSAASHRHPVSARRLPEDGSGVSGGAIRLGDLAVAVESLATTDPAHLVDLTAAGVLSLEMGADSEAVAGVMESFEPGPHRRKVVATIDDIDYVDDSKATNPHAALAALAAFRSVVLIAGGLPKGLDLAPLASAPSVRALIAIGTAAPALLEAAGERGRPAGSMEEAVALAHEIARPGDTVLLAPGAASFDQYQSYAARGDAFAACVDELRKGER